MLTTHSLTLSFPSSPAPTPRSSLPPSSRAALADSTNVKSHSNAHGSSYLRRSVYPIPSTRAGRGLSNSEPSVGSTFHSRSHYVSSTSSPFLVTCKAPPTVSISLSAACSQNIPGKCFGGARMQGLEPDLLDVRSVVPFPSMPLDKDVDMLDGTCAPCPDGRLPSVGQAPRKRRSAHSSVSASQGNHGKDAKQKRPRKSRRHVAELVWLGVVHRSILRAIEARQLDASERPSGQCELDAMDHTLVERIQKRLVENGCEGRTLPNPLPRISSSSISVPSLSLVTPCKTLPRDSTSSELLHPQVDGDLNGTATSPPTSKQSHCAALPIPIPVSLSHRRHVRFEIPQPRRQTQTHPAPRRSPSPPARSMESVPTNGKTPTLTMPQLVASLTLSHHERGGLRMNGRGYRTECGKNAGPSPHSVPGQAVHGDGICYESLAQRSRPSHTPERRSPLSRVAYPES